ncbi:hypothetical protein ACKWTF_000703 [Chironomus riparius]
MKILFGYFVINFVFITLSSNSKLYHEIFYTRADPRIRDKLLMGDPAPILIISTTLILFLTVILRKFMKNREPFRLKNFELFMNFIYSAISVYFFIKSSKFYVFHYSWKCEKIDTSDSPLALEAVYTSYFYFITKFIFIIENVLIELKKNDTSFVIFALVHHFMYPFIIWHTINYFPSGQPLFYMFVNSLAHIVMFPMKLYVAYFTPKWIRYKAQIGVAYMVSFAYFC